MLGPETFNSNTPSLQILFHFLKHLRPQLHCAQYRRGAPSGPGRTGMRRSLSLPTSDKRSRSPASGRPGRGPVKNFILPLRAQLAGVTFAAAFVGKEVRQPLQHVAHVRAIVEDHNCAGAKGQAGRAQVLKRQDHIQDLSQRQMRRRRRP